MGPHPQVARRLPVHAGGGGDGETRVDERGAADAVAQADVAEAHLPRLAGGGDGGQQEELEEHEHSIDAKNNLSNIFKSFLRVPTKLNVSSAPSFQDARGRIQCRNFQLERKPLCSAEPVCAKQASNSHRFSSGRCSNVGIAN